MVLSDGLHQFLQIKHSIQLTAENLVTSFVSNVGYFKRYGTNIYGLTGTIGTEKSQLFLKSEYKINIGFVPSFKKKQLKEVPVILNQNLIKWRDKICDIAICESKKHRAVLIVNETIENANIIKGQILELKFPRKNLISCTGVDEENIPQTVDSEVIIVSTNLAGRGTDINTTDNVEANGGLHVIVTFLPQNQRVQDQAFGRSARKGKKGTCQLILDKDEVQKQLGRVISDDSDILKLRDDIEIIKQTEVQNKYMNETFIKDEIFKKFSEYITKDPECKDSNHKASIVEKWAIFLKSAEQKKKMEREEINENLKNRCYDFGVKAYDVSNKESGFYTALHSQLQIIPKYKNKTITEIKEDAIIAIIKNQDIKINTKEEKRKFFENYADCSKWKDNKIIESISKEYMLNVVIIDAAKSNIEIIKISNNPNATIILARQNGRFLTCFHEDESNTTISSEILKAPIISSDNCKDAAAKSKKNISMEEAKELAVPIIKEMEVKQYEQSQINKEKELKELEQEFDKFKKDCDEGLTPSNPVHSTKQGNKLVSENKHKEAIEKYGQAIQEDPNYSMPARYNKAMAIIMENKENGVSDVQKQDIIDNFEKAKNIINNTLIPQVKACLVQFSISKRASDLSEIENTDIAKQCSAKICVLSTINKNIEDNLQIVNSLSTKDERLRIGGSIMLSEIFKDNYEQLESAEEYERSGIQELKAIISEKKPVDKGILEKLLMIGIGIAQVAVGAYLDTISGGFASILSGPLIQSGFNDIFTGTKSLLTGEDIQWKQWAIDKVCIACTTALSYGISKITEIVSKLDGKSLPGTVFKKIQDFSQNKFTGKFAILQKIGNNQQIMKIKDSLFEEAKKKFDNNTKFITKQLENVVDKTGIKDTSKLNKVYADIIQKIVNHIRKTFNAGIKVPDNLVKQTIQLIIYDNLIGGNATISAFESKICQSAFQNINAKSIIDKIVTNISKALKDEDKKEKSFKYFEQNDVDNFFKEFKVKQLLNDFALCATKNVSEISESICKQITPFGQVMMIECSLNENELSKIMKILVNNKIVDPDYQYIVSNYSKIKDIKCNTKETEMISKCQEFLSKIGSISSQLIRDKSKAESKVSLGISRYNDQLIVALTKKLEDFSFENDPKFKKNCDESFSNANKNIQDRLCGMDQDISNYIPVNFFEEDDKKQTNLSKANKFINNMISCNPNGGIQDISLLSNTLSNPIQVIKDGKIFETFGDKFRGNPIVAEISSNIENGSKWLDSNGVPADSIYHLAAKSLNKDYDDVLDQCSKGLSKANSFGNKLEASISKLDGFVKPFLNFKGE